MASTINASTSPAAIVQTADGTGILSLQTGNTTAVTIDASQNVGIGTTSPSGKLDVTGTVYGGKNGTQGYIGIQGSGDTTHTGYIEFLAPNGTRKGYIGYADMSGSGQFNIWGESSTNALAFATNSTERMRIDSSGNVLMGVTAQRYGTCKLVAEATSNQAAFLGTNYSGDVSNAAVYVSKYDNNTTTSQVFMRFIVNNITSGSGQINANGASAAAFGSWSDIRLKENIEPLPSQLNNIMSLKPCEFDFKGYTDGMGHQIGFIAQDMQKVYPDVISEGEDGMLMITGWSKTEARLVKAIQEQQQIITDLKATVDSHVAIINDLKARVTALEAK